MKAMITTKLTEFVTECEDDTALTTFLSKIHHARFAHSTIDVKGEKKVFVVFNDSSSKVYSPRELIEEILLDEAKMKEIPQVVHPIKDHIDYKKRVNYFA